MGLTPSDDRRHAPDDGTTALWLETFGFEFAADDGLRGAVRLTFAPTRGKCAWWTVLVGATLGSISVRDHGLPIPRRADSLEVRGDGLWAELMCETPFEHWGVSLEAFGLRVDDLNDEIGDRLPVGLDLEWEVDAGESNELSSGEAGYTQSGTLRGEVLVADARIAIDATCQRDHAWGQISPPTWPPRLPDWTDG